MVALVGAPPVASGLTTPQRAWAWARAWTWASSWWDGALSLVSRGPRLLASLLFLVSSAAGTAKYIGLSALPLPRTDTSGLVRDRRTETPYKSDISRAPFRFADHLLILI